MADRGPRRDPVRSGNVPVSVVADMAQRIDAATRTGPPDALDHGKPPSTADADLDDQTIRQCCAFAKREGCSGITVVNLFAYRTPSPKVLRTEYERVHLAWIEGPDNYRHVEAQLHAVTMLNGLVVCAWGDCVRGLPVSPVVSLLRGRELWCLGLTAAGNPRHPARLGHDTDLVPYSL